MPDLSTLSGFVALIVASLVGLSTWNRGKGSLTKETIELQQQQITALERQVAANKALVEQLTRDLFNMSVKFESQQTNYRALGVRFMEQVARIDWLERREKQLVRVLEQADIEVPELVNDPEWE